MHMLAFFLLMHWQVNRAAAMASDETSRMCKATGNCWLSQAVSCLYTRQQRHLVAVHGSHLSVSMRSCPTLSRFLPDHAQQRANQLCNSVNAQLKEDIREL